MKIIDPLARPLESPALVTIPMRDGVMLSARLWLPVLAPGERVPAIVDCHPYRVTDSSAIGNSRVYPYYAAHGYGCLRVDLRGSGNSEGILRDEYLAQEQDDGVDVINWCATQEWCTGAVGWTGISWGGFAALQEMLAAPQHSRQSSLSVPPMTATLTTSTTAASNHNARDRNAFGVSLRYATEL